MPGRNRNLRVLGGPGHNYFLKQAPRGETGPEGPLAVEAALYQWAAADPAAARLRSLLPTLRQWDAERSILALDLVPSSESMPDDASAEYRAEHRRLLADALATCHRLPADGTVAPSFLPAAPPWIFDLARPVPAMLRELSPAQLSLIQALQAAPDAVAALERLRDEWRPTCLIHGDIKWNNVLVRQGGLTAGILLVDWELAQLGDPAWDVGAALHAFILDAVLELEPAQGAGPEQAAALLGGAISRLHPAHREFLSRYTASSGAGPDDADRLQARLPGHVAARMIKTAFEWGQSEAQVPRRAAAIHQLGINMLRHPRTAGQVVLGLARETAIR